MSSIKEKKYVRNKVDFVFSGKEGVEAGEGCEGIYKMLEYCLDFDSFRRQSAIIL